MKLIITLGGLLLSAFVQAATLKDIVVFGDSLSDNGNLYEYMEHRLPESPPYFAGRFTNGPVWVERLVASYFPDNPKAHLQDYAFGGAGVSEAPGSEELFTLRNEVNSYLLAHEQADPNSLFIVWIGANNYLDVPGNDDEAVALVAQGIAHSLQRLVDAGAKHVLVLNLPDLGKSPEARELGMETQLTALCQKHNEALTANLRELEAANPDVQWLHYDVNQIIDRIFSNPAQYGFTNVTDTCYDVQVEKPTQKGMLRIAAKITAKNKMDSCQGYLFFDPVHPTAPAHQIMADSARQLLDEADIHFATE